MPSLYNVYYNHFAVVNKLKLEKLSINQMLRSLNYWRNGFVALAMITLVSFVSNAQDAAGAKAKVDGAGLFGCLWSGDDNRYRWRTHQGTFSAQRSRSTLI